MYLQSFDFASDTDYLLSNEHATLRTEAKMSNVGYVYSGADKGKSGDFLTWSDKDGYRIWIHSKASGSSREIVSVELQAIGTNSFKPSKEELAMRLKLCARIQLPKEKISSKQPCLGLYLLANYWKSTRT